MNIVTLASQVGGAGKSTLTAHLAAAARRSGYHCLLIDADPAGVLTEWNARRQVSKRPIESGTGDIDATLRMAAHAGYDWAFVDTPATLLAGTRAAISASTLVVIPVRPCQFDLASVRRTIKAARDQLCPYVVLLNAAPAQRLCDEDAPAVAYAREQLNEFSIPTWPGQISQRAAYPISLAVGGTVLEIAPESAACAELAGLWSAVERLVAVINETRSSLRPRARGGRLAA
ncbi:MAG: ParA family protein [Xanthobacteraceae bacterium]